MKNNTLDYRRERPPWGKWWGAFLGNISLILLVIYLTASVVVNMNHPSRSIDPRVPVYEFFDELLFWINIIGIPFGFMSAFLNSKRGGVACFLLMILLFITPSRAYS
jgi:ABC-type transport system involved in multi-copper enzyme maturation permease subunit